MVDAVDLKSTGYFYPCRFKSGLRHHDSLLIARLVSGKRNSRYFFCIQYRTACSFLIKRLQRNATYENIAGWSSQVARRAHNPEVVGSNPTPATKTAV